MVYSDRYACMSDLNNYFKKADLLKGLSEAEKVQLRSNIKTCFLAGFFVSEFYAL